VYKTPVKFNEGGPPSPLSKNSDGPVVPAIGKIAVIEEALETANIEPTPEVTSQFGIIGNSPPMQELYSLIERFSSGDFCVTILGETGTGKELVARAIHNAGRRRLEPFVPVDCAAVSPSLIESEFFGHVRGAFTGAVCSRTGPFVAARGGTIFLDEVGELPLELQAKLLRAIQERTIRPVGGNESIRVDARFVVATNRDLWACVCNDTFRSDLYFRLAVGQIKVPRLRDRKSDIPLLATAFLEKVSSKRTVISNSAMTKLVRYAWPGNVRELENVIHRAAILCEDAMLDIEDLPSEVIDDDEAASLDIGDLESRMIRLAMSKAHGDKLAAAKMLGICRSTLYRKLRIMEQNESERKAS